MAKIKLGPAFAGASGSIGGTTFSHNRYGTYTRQRRSPVQPQTPPQVAQRAAFTFVSQYWRNTLTAAEREAWIDYAAQTPVTDVFGDSQVLPGNAMFTRFNAFWYRTQLAVVAAAPTTPGMAPAMSSVLAGTTVLGLQITALAPGLLAADRIGIFIAAAPVSQAKNFYGGPYTLLYTVGGNTAVPLTLLAPALVAVGQRWYIELRAFVALGRVGPRSRYSADITV